MSARSARVAQQSPGRMRANTGQPLRSPAEQQQHQHQRQHQQQHQEQQEQERSFIYEDDAGDIVEFEDPYDDVDVGTILQSFQDELEALNNRWKQVESHLSLLTFTNGRPITDDGTSSTNRGTPNRSRNANINTPSRQSKENQTMSNFNTATKSNKTTNDKQYETPQLVPTYTTYTTDSKAPFSVKDPPPSAERFSPLRNYVDRSTPVRREKGESSVRSYSTRHSVETPAEPPPAPVETPHPASYATPNRQRREQPPRMRTDPQDDILSQLKAALEAQEKQLQTLELENQTLKEQLHEQPEIGRDRLLFASELGSITSNLQLDLDETMTGTTTMNAKYTPPPQAPPPPAPVDPRMENEYGLPDEGYRGHHRTMESSGMPPVVPRRDDNDGVYEIPPNNDQRQGYEPLGRRPVDISHDDVSSFRPTPMSTPARNPTSPPKRVHISSAQGGDATNHQSHHQTRRQTTTTTTTLGTVAIPEEELWVSEGLSRGTRFVAKLSKLMDVQPGQQAPMSVLVDQHWDEIKHFFESTSSD
ncbi:unnamed protein product [Cylindrotheca closterium]|uniref:Uncharacterized protein n=1 Tax=Cylindrotheca closterium TaxID=2856 RepID=A0AAD2CMV2_9STRA|nr:unnamed protein product [Cylindrotheca closterium]